MKNGESMFDSKSCYIISVNVDGSRRYILDYRQTVANVEFARRFNERDTAMKYLRKYKFEGYSPNVEKIERD